MNGAELRLGKSLAAKTIESLGMSLPRAKRADIETLRTQCRDQTGIVDLRIMGQSRKAGESIEPQPWQHVLRPFGNEFDIGKTVGRRKSGARIDDDHFDIRELRHRREGLRNMHGAHDDQPTVGNLHEQKEIAAIDLHSAALAETQPFHQMRRQPVLAGIGRGDKFLLARF